MSSRCVVGYYFSPESILKAAERTKNRDFKKFDTFTPFPVHGMDEAMGIKRSWLPYASFVAAMAGLGGGAFIQIWTHLYSWPINVAGKPLFALPAYFPVMFETTVLVCGVFTAVFMFTALLGLPNYRKPIFHPDITNDRFALAIQVDDESEVEPVREFLREIQAAEIHDVEGRL